MWLYFKSIKPAIFIFSSNLYITAKTGNKLKVLSGLCCCAGRKVYHYTPYVLSVVFPEFNGHSTEPHVAKKL